MNWIKEKLFTKAVAVFVLGCILGGFAIGIIDVKRVNPLFSSADDVNYPGDCEATVNQASQQLASINSNIPFSNQGQYDNWVREYWNLVEAARTCFADICEPILYDLHDAWADVQDAIRLSSSLRRSLREAERLAEQAYSRWEISAQNAHSANEEFEQYQASITFPYTDQQQATLNQLRDLAVQLEGIASTDESYYRQLEDTVNDLSQQYQEAEQAYSEAMDAHSAVNAEYAAENCSVNYQPPDPDDNEVDDDPYYRSSGTKPY